MRDTNFFEPYIDKKEIDFKGKNVIVLVVAGVVVVSLILFPIVNKIRFYRMNKEIVRIDNELNSSQNKIKKDQVETKRQEIAELKEKDKILGLIADDFYKKDNVGDFLVLSITDSMTDGMFLKDVDITDDEVTVSGIAKQKKDIARLERNFRRIAYFKDVFIPSITLNEDYYEFAVNIKINNEEVNLKKQQQAEEIKKIKELEEAEDRGEEIEAE